MQDHHSHQSDNSAIPTKLKVPTGEALKAPGAREGAVRRGSPRTKSHRITFRVADDVYQGLLARSHDQGCDLSHVIRDALNGSIKPETTPNGPQKPILRTAEIDQLVDDYRAVVKEDIRHVRKRLFGHLLAASYVTKTNFPRTAGTTDAYQSLLKLQHLFGYGENV
jgi:hypothetical protein